MWIQFNIAVLCILLLSSCKNLVPVTTGQKYIGNYNQVNQPASRLTIGKEGIVYKITLISEGEEWIGSGYESSGKVIAVLKQENSEVAVFATLALAGEDQLFVIARNLDGSYKWDGYFRELED